MDGRKDRQTDERKAGGPVKVPCAPSLKSKQAGLSRAVDGLGAGELDPSHIAQCTPVLKE